MASNDSIEDPSLPVTDYWNKLPDLVKVRVFELAGREASFEFRLTSKANSRAWYAIRGQFQEPFNYWDWHGLTREEWCLRIDRRKKRLCLGRKRVSQDNIEADGCYVGRERWQRFRKSGNRVNLGYVRRIAVANWMTLDDINWIAENLPTLEELDLSDIREGPGAEPGQLALGDCWYAIAKIFAKPRLRWPLIYPDDIESLAGGTRPGKYSLKVTPYEILGFQTKLFSLLKALQDEHGNISHRVESEWTAVSQEINSTFAFWGNEATRRVYKRMVAQTILQRVSWVGIRSHLEPHAMEEVVSKFEALQTLSIRGPYDDDAAFADIPGDTDSLIRNIASNIPSTVKRVELRLSFPSIGKLMDALKDRLSGKVKEIGIDLGAWIQLYPPRTQHPARESVSGVNIADLKLQRRFTTFGQAQDDVLGSTSNVHAGGRNASDESSESEEWEDALARGTDDFSTEVYGKDSNNSDDENAENHPEPDPTKETPEPESGPLSLRSNLEPARYQDIVNCLGQMLHRLYKWNAKGKRSGIRLVPLSAEPQMRSKDPIHPLALIQVEKEVVAWSSDYNATADFDPERDMENVYQWLNTTFSWRPIFDWDWFMLPGRMRETLDPVYSLTYSDPLFFDRIETHFRMLRKAGIPLHLLIGKRPQKESSLYWGAVSSASEWEQWYNSDFSANFERVAPLVDRLDIFYDVRNPLSQERLEDIDKLDPENAPPRKRQRMANKRSLSKVNATEHKRKLLPTFFGSLGPTTLGEDADEHPSDDSDLDEHHHFRGSLPPIISRDSPLHHLARRAAYLREAVGWQRFWALYGLNFTAVKQLRIRMPRSFDNIASFRLANVLSSDVGWTMLTYTDERQSMQSLEDLLPYLDFDALLRGYRDVPILPRKLIEWPENAKEMFAEEKKLWPGGRFVRRMWMWSPEEYEKMRRLGSVQAVSCRYGERRFTESERENTEAEEEKEFRRSVNVAAVVAEKEAKKHRICREILEEMEEYEAIKNKKAQSERDNAERDAEKRRSIQGILQQLVAPRNEERTENEPAVAENEPSDLTEPEFGNPEVIINKGHGKTKELESEAETQNPEVVVISDTDDETEESLRPPAPTPSFGLPLPISPLPTALVRPPEEPSTLSSPSSDHLSPPRPLEANAGHVDEDFPDLEDISQGNMSDYDGASMSVQAESITHSESATHLPPDQPVIQGEATALILPSKPRSDPSPRLTKAATTIVKTSTVTVDIDSTSPSEEQPRVEPPVVYVDFPDDPGGEPTAYVPGSHPGLENESETAAQSESDLTSESTKSPHGIRKPARTTRKGDSQNIEPEPSKKSRSTKKKVVLEVEESTVQVPATPPPSSPPKGSKTKKNIEKQDATGETEAERIPESAPPSVTRAPAKKSTPTVHAEHPIPTVESTQSTSKPKSTPRTRKRKVGSEDTPHKPESPPSSDADDEPDPKAVRDRKKKKPSKGENEYKPGNDDEDAEGETDDEVERRKKRKVSKARDTVYTPGKDEADEESGIEEKGRGKGKAKGKKAGGKGRAKAVKTTRVPKAAGEKRKAEVQEPDSPISRRTRARTRAKSQEAGAGT